MKQNTFAIMFVLLSCLLTSACTTSRDVGPYRVEVVKDGFGGAFCQPHTELFFIDQSSGSEKITFLGACGTPRLITEQFGMPGDPSCYAIAADSASIVYFHSPNICGGGDKSTHKTGGVYIHTAKEGDKLLYKDNLVSQMWSQRPIDSHSIRVSWISSKTPSAKGALCGQDLVLSSDGMEMVEGKPSKTCSYDY